MRRIILFGLLFLFTAAAVAATQAAGDPEYLVFYQKNADLRTLYIMKPGDAAPVAIATGRRVETFVGGGTLLYWKDQSLYQYDPEQRKDRFLAEFNAVNISLSMIPDSPDQALVVAEGKYDIAWYILDLKDGNIRKIQQPSWRASNSGGSSARSLSPDGRGRAIVRVSGMRYELTIQMKNSRGDFVTQWVSPKDTTTTAELPVWSPDSRYLAYYTRQDKGLEGFYDLNIFYLLTGERRLIKGQVFAKGFLENLQSGSYRPVWSKNSQYLLYEYQPFGSPTQTVIMRYDVTAGKNTTLIDGPGANQYPTWSPSGEYIMFISDREGSQSQLFIIDHTGLHLRRISPGIGFTEWADWFQPKK